MLKSFTVYRDRWLRGEGATHSQLQRESDNKRCCLGFYCLAAGVSEEAIIGKGNPGALACSLDRDLLHPALTDGALEDFALPKIMGTNDDVRLADGTREALLIQQFRAIGITVKFADGYGSSEVAA